MDSRAAAEGQTGTMITPPGSEVHLGSRLMPFNNTEGVATNADRQACVGQLVESQHLLGQPDKLRASLEDNGCVCCSAARHHERTISPADPGNCDASPLLAPAQPRLVPSQSNPRPSTSHSHSSLPSGPLIIFLCKNLADTCLFAGCTIGRRCLMPASIYWSTYTAWASWTPISQCRRLVQLD